MAGMSEVISIEAYRQKQADVAIERVFRFAGMTPEQRLVFIRRLNERRPPPPPPIPSQTDPLGEK